MYTFCFISDWQLTLWCLYVANLNSRTTHGEEMLNQWPFQEIEGPRVVRNYITCISQITMANEHDVEKRGVLMFKKKGKRGWNIMRKNWAEKKEVKMVITGARLAPSTLFIHFEGWLRCNILAYQPYPWFKQGFRFVIYEPSSDHLQALCQSESDQCRLIFMFLALRDCIKISLRAMNVIRGRNLGLR